jgi:hypothetical protein
MRAGRVLHTIAASIQNVSGGPASWLVFCSLLDFDIDTATHNSFLLTNGCVTEGADNTPTESIP